MISNSYGALKEVGLFRTLTPRSETTDIAGYMNAALRIRNVLPDI